MTDFIIKKLPKELTSNAGFALVGQLIKHLGIESRVERQFSVGVGCIANSNKMLAW